MSPHQEGLPARLKVINHLINKLMWSVLCVVMRFKLCRSPTCVLINRWLSDQLADQLSNKHQNKEMSFRIWDCWSIIKLFRNDSLWMWYDDRSRRFFVYGKKNHLNCFDHQSFKSMKTKLFLFGPINQWIKKIISKIINNDELLVGASRVEL